MKDLLGKCSELKVLVIGDIMLDHYIIGDALRISPEAPVPVVAVERDKYVLGAAANVAMNTAKMGCATEIVGKIGCDRAGGMVKALLKDNSIRFDEQFEAQNVDTITKARVVVRGQQLCRIDRENRKSSYSVFEEHLLTAICEKIIQADAVILSDYAKGTFSSQNVSKFIDVANANGVFIAMDPKPINRLEFRGLSLMTPNRGEAMQLAGIDPDEGSIPPLQEICDEILKKYQPKTLAITLGGDGMLVCQPGGHFFQIPTYAQEVFDVSGAGDTSVACLTLALAAGEPPARAANFANIAAGIVVAKHGTVPIDRQELLSSGNCHFLNFEK